MEGSTHRTPFPGLKPTWLTLDCYGMLIQLDEYLLAAVEGLLRHRGAADLDPEKVLDVFDRHEDALERAKPHMSFRKIGAEALKRTLSELELPFVEGDETRLFAGFAKAPPFPDAVEALAALKRMGFMLCIVTNSDDAIIAPSIGQLGGHIDRVVTAEQAESYKPDRGIFDHAHKSLGLTYRDVLHVTASPRFDLAAARDIGFRCAFVDRGHGRKQLPDYRPDLTVTSLHSLVERLEALGW